MFYVYVLQSQLDVELYIGYTRDLKRRVRQRNSGESNATSSRCPLKLIYYEAYLAKNDAEGRGQFLKSGSERRHLRKQLRHHFEQYPYPAKT